MKSSSMILALLLSTATVSAAFATSAPPAAPRSAMHMADASATASSSNYLFDPKERDAHYGDNMAQYLLDLHESEATFDFCGGMLFQLVLTDALRDHLKTNTAVVVFDVPRMSMTSDYTESAQADNTRIFHGREIRQVPTAAGGMGMVLQLSLANGEDPEGWSPQEQDRYDGWGHDSGREWRKGPQLIEEGFGSFEKQFGPSAFSLHHRFFLHYDRAKRMWLSAEDGCEGTPAMKQPAGLSNLFGLL